MGQEYERLFGALPDQSVPAYLCERVLGTLARERVRALRTRLVFSSCAGALSLLASVFAVKNLISAMHASGFTSYASLMVSDSGSVAGSKAFALTLLESLPGIETIMVLFVLAVLIQSVRVALASALAWSDQPAYA